MIRQSAEQLAVNINGASAIPHCFRHDVPVTLSRDLLGILPAFGSGVSFRIVVFEGIGGRVGGGDEEILPSVRIYPSVYSLSL